MPFEIIRADITTLDVDAIVNAAKNNLQGGGGVDGAIHDAAGPLLLKECKSLGGCKTGDAKLTKGYDLKARYVIHTVGPVWQGGVRAEEKLLRSCYRKSLNLAVAKGLETIAFPLISAGIYGYPKDLALKVAVSEIADFLSEHELMVFLVIYDRESYEISEKLYAKVQAFIDEHLVIEELDERRCEIVTINRADEIKVRYSTRSFDPSPKAPRGLADVLSEIEDTFSEQLLRLIDQKGMTDVQAYKQANVNRKLFSKIRNDRYYKPSKATAMAFAVALQLNLDETKDILLKAGYALSPSSKFDMIIRYFIEQGNPNIYEINETLFAFDQPLIGA